MKRKPAAPAPPPPIPIREIRGQRVLLDADLAAIYGVPTKALNQAVRRNAARFPADFRWQLSAAEWSELADRSQIVTGSEANAADERSQIVTGSRAAEVDPQRHRDPRFLPHAFTEHGALQVANILKSERAAAMSVFVIRAFIQMREQIVANAAVLRRLAEIDKTLLDHDHALRTVWTQLQPLLTPPPDLPKPKIGFQP